MAELNFPEALSRSLSYPEEYRASAGQDGLFFGAELLERSPLEAVCHAKDGERFLKGQTLMTIFASKKLSSLKSAVSAAGYLSGACSLARCYKESACRALIAGSPSADSPFPEWERQALRLGGVNTEPPVPARMIASKEDLAARLKEYPEIIALDGSKLPPDELESLARRIPRAVRKGVYGAFLPKDLERLDELLLDVIWPSFLQGGFPRIKISLSV